MKKLIYLLSLLIMLTSASALDQIFTGWIYSGESVTLDDIEYKVLIGKGGNSALITFNDNTIIVPIYDCETANTKVFCFNFSTYDNSIENYKAYMEFYYSKPSVSIDRDVENNLIKIWETTSFEVTVKNNGDEDADDLEYVEYFPPQFEIGKVTGCRKEGNSVVWRGDLKQDQSFTCTYEATPIAEVDAYVTASVTYYDGLELREVFSDEVHLYASEILEFKYGIDDSSLEIGQPGKITINLTNRGTEEIDMKYIKAQIPDSLIVDYANLDLENGEYVWDGDINANESKILTIKVKGKLSGTSVIWIHTEHEYENEIYTNLNRKLEVEVENKGISFTSMLDENQEIEANSQIRFTTGVINKNQYSEIRNLEAVVDSGISYISSGALNKIPGNQSNRIIDSVFPAPDVDTTTTYIISVNVSYDTEYGEHFSELFERSFKVVPIDKIEITIKTSENVIEEEKSLTVTVDVINKRKSDIDDVYVYDTLPPGFSINGQNSNHISLEQGEKKTAYTYTVQGPHVGNRTEYIILTTAFYQKDGNEYAFSNSKEFAVIPKIPILDIKKSISGNVYRGEIISVEYIIENNENSAAHDLELVFSDHPEFDSIGDTGYILEEIAPGEKLTIKEELKRPKTVGSYVLDGSVLAYTDKLNRRFNVTTDSTTIEVLEAGLHGPAISIKKSLDKASACTNEDIAIKLEAENIGTEKTIALVRDGIKDWTIELNAGEKKLIEYTKSFSTPGEYLLEAAEVTYSYIHEYRAKSGRSSVLIKKCSQGVEVKVDEIENPDNTNSSSSVISEVTDEKQPDNLTLLQRIIKWIKGLFGHHSS